MNNTFLTRFLATPMFAPNDGGGAGALPVDDPDAGGTISEDAGKWWDDQRFSDDQRTQIEALGLAVDDPLDAVKSLADMETAAKKKLGKSANQLLDRPEEGQDVAEWLKGNGDVFGIPEASDQYEINRPDDFPEDAWSTELEGKARDIGHQLGLSQTQLQGVVEMYAGHMQGILGSSEGDQASVQEVMRADLRKDWGAETEEKMGQAREASMFLAEQAGLDAAATTAMADTLSEKVGDANVIRMFAAIGEAMADDEGMLSLRGGSSLTSTPEEAKAQLDQMMASGSEYRTAMASKRAGKPAPDYVRLHKEYLRLNKIVAS